MDKLKWTLPREQKVLGEEITALRLSRDLSQTALAHLVGISNKTLQNIEAGRNWPSMQVYVVICKVLGVGKPLLLNSLSEAEWGRGVDEARAKVRRR
jgi:DNA-binding XRE family transcriptional regulator